jgi:hypothetical protein
MRFPVVFILSAPAPLVAPRNIDDRRDSGAESGEKRLAERAGAKRRPPSADGSAPLMRFSRIQIVTSTRFAQRNGRGREGDMADRKPVESGKEMALPPSPPLRTGRETFASSGSSH